MTAIPASAARNAATPFESLLLRAASAVDQLVAARLEQRGGTVYRRAAATQAAAAAARGAAQARGAIGVLPR
jgi:hypothetical protein